LSVYDSLAVTTEDTLGPLAASAAISSSNISALEPDGSLRFFWLDYLELDGRIYFIGKLKDKNSGAWVSCCVTVEGVQRNLFVLPREKRVEEDDEGQLQETDDVPDLQNVYSDFDRVRKKIGIKSWKAKFVKRKYAFGEPDVPKQESQWMKVVYGFDGDHVCSEVFFGD
jgi:DNA polymerase alpha subunit A